jgi:bacillithiol synthase
MHSSAAFTGGSSSSIDASKPSGTYLDTLPKALREYGTVSAEPTTSATQGSSVPVLFEGGAKRTSLDVRRFPWIRPLAWEYANNFRKVASLYAGDPTAPSAWQDTIGRVQRHARNHQGIADVIAAQQASRNAPPEAREAAAKLAEARTVAVVTGQQAGAFGGPMYTLLKAITAIQLARRTANEHGAQAIAIFWVDAEDHDWAEVASATVLDEVFQAKTVTLAPPEGAGEMPVAALTLDPRIDESVNEMARALQTTEFSDWVISSVRDAYRPGIRMADAFARWLEALLGPYGLVVFESADPAAKPLAADVFVRELQTPGRTASLAAAAGERLAALGHAAQVQPQPDSISLFHLNGGRKPIRRQGDDAVIGAATIPLTALVEEANRAPQNFSPNVLLRPIIQDTLFPTICYVAGPSELAYLGQLGGVYQHFGPPMPLVYPRATATLIDSAAARFLSRHTVPFEDFQPQDESALNRLLESQLPASVEQAMREADDSVRRSMQRVAEVMPALDPTLAGAAKTTLGKMEHDLKGLHTKVIHAAKRRNETLKRQFTRAQSQIFPDGHPQERTLAVVYFLNRYGPALIDRLLEELPLDLGQHWLITL